MKGHEWAKSPLQEPFQEEGAKSFPPPSPSPSPSPTKQFETLQFPSLRSRGSFAFSVHTYFVQLRRRRKRADVSGNFSRAFYFGWGGGGEIGFGGIFRIARGNLFGTFPSHAVPEMQKKIGDFSFLLLQKRRLLERDTIASFLCSACYCTV